MARATGTKVTLSAKADKESFKKEFLIWVDDSSKVSKETIDVNKASVVQEAIQHGLRPDGEVSLVSQEARGTHNVFLTYSVDVK